MMSENQNTFETILLGTIPAVPEFVCLMLAFMAGGFLFKYIKATKSAELNATKPGKPDALSWSYFAQAKENVQEFVVALICGWAFIRFLAPTDDVMALLGICFGVGLMGQATLLDMIFEFARNGDPLKTVKKFIKSAQK